jgi:hypothetical protein
MTTTTRHPFIGAVGQSARPDKFQVPSPTAYPRMIEADRRRNGFTVGRVAWRLGISPNEYRALEVGDAFPDFDTWDQICKLYGWSQTFADS